jgi:hypothetical protein
MLLSVAGVAVASPPRWSMPVVTLPSVVSPGSPAGYRVTVANAGPSNISALFLVSDKLDTTPVYLTSSRPGTCGETGTLTSPLFCSFGALNAGDSVSITVAYATLSSANSFAIQFQANTSGSTFSDVKNRSHGDLLTTAVSTALNANKDFAGTFSTLTGTAIGDSDVLTGSNKQATKLANLPAGVEATVEDGPGATGSCTSTDTIDCNKLFGEWSVVSVGEGQAFETPFWIQITYKSGTPTGFVHSFGDQQELISKCGATIVAPCFTWSGNTATIYTLHNGGVKGI